MCFYVNLLLTTTWRKVPSGCTSELELLRSFQVELNCLNSKAVGNTEMLPVSHVTGMRPKATVANKVELLGFH